MITTMMTTMMTMLTMKTTVMTTTMKMMTIDVHPTPFFNLSTPDRTVEIESAATEAKHKLADADNDDEDHI